MRALLPGWSKNIIRFIVYKNQRQKVFREPHIRKSQNELLRKDYNLKTEKLIVFIVNGADWFTGKDRISGGILSIASIYEETEKLIDIHGSKVIMVTAPNAHLLLKHTQFPNEINVYRFGQLKKFKNITNILFHIPEYMFQNELIKKISDSFKHLSNHNIHLNILNQRIDIMPDTKIINDVKKEGYQLSQTTAHERYSTPEVRAKFGIPLHKLSVYATPERYEFVDFEKKENLILISPDEVLKKPVILKKLTTELTSFKILVIRDITYLKYLSLVKKAKYMVTFGEGLDFYFIETVFSGGISFAVYNEEFFTEDFKGDSCIFNSYSVMEDKIVDQIKSFENSITEYEKKNKEQFDNCYTIYNEKYYKKNLADFYNGKYLYP